MPQQSPARRALAVLAVLAGLLTAGCDALGGSVGVSDRSRLVADMVSQLGRASELRYHAEFQLAGGGRGSISQELQPNRLALAYPGGVLMVAGAEQTSCATMVRPVRCQIRLVSGEAALPVPSYREATEHGLISPAIVADLLTAVSAQPLAGLRAYDATVAGQLSTCLEVTGLAEPAASAAFSVCVTADGALASFAGTVAGIPVDQALTRYDRQPPAELFAVPPGAQLVDHRPKTS